MKNICKACDNLDKGFFKTVLGLAKDAAKEGGKALGRWANALESSGKAFVDDMIGGFKKCPSAAETIFSWAGEIVGIGATVYENYQENKGDPVRFVAESVTEVIVDRAIGATISAGLTFVGAALLGATPAGWVVALGGVVVKGVADWACKKAFGKSSTELISDAILDGASWLGNKVGNLVGKKVANKAVETITNVNNTFSSCLRSAQILNKYGL